MSFCQGGVGSEVTSLWIGAEGSNWRFDILLIVSEFVIVLLTGAAGVDVLVPSIGAAVGVPAFDEARITGIL